MAQIINKAKLQYNNVTVVSNEAKTNLEEPIAIAKCSLDDTYTLNKEITSIVSIKNNNVCSECSIKIVDDLGGNVCPETPSTPLEYVGNAKLFLENSTTCVNIKPTATAPLEFNLPYIPPQTVATLVYKAKVTNYADLVIGSTITNTIVATACNCTVEDDYTVLVEEYADVQMVKSMSPNPVVNGGSIVYTFEVYNYGNVSASDDAVFSDTFNPAPKNISVKVNGVPLIYEEDYIYDETTGLLTITNTPENVVIPIEPATIIRNEEDCTVTVTPSETIIEVTGTLPNVTCGD